MNRWISLVLLVCCVFGCGAPSNPKDKLATQGYVDRVVGNEAKERAAFDGAMMDKLLGLDEKVKGAQSAGDSFMGVSGDSSTDPTVLPGPASSATGTAAVPDNSAPPPAVVQAPSDPFAGQFGTVNDKLDELKREVQSKHDALAGELGKVRQAQSAHDERLQRMEGKLDDLGTTAKSNHTATTQAMGGLKTGLDALSQGQRDGIASLNGKMDSAQKDLTEVKGAVNTLKAGQEKARTERREIRRKVGKVENDMSGVQSSIKVIRTDVDLAVADVAAAKQALIAIHPYPDKGYMEIWDREYEGRGGKGCSSGPAYIYRVYSQRLPSGARELSLQAYCRQSFNPNAANIRAIVPSEWGFAPVALEESRNGSTLRYSYLEENALGKMGYKDSVFRPGFPTLAYLQAVWDKEMPPASMGVVSECNSAVLRRGPALNGIPTRQANYSRQ